VAEANVKLTVDARPAVRATNALKAAVDKTQQAVKKLEGAVQGTGRAFKRLGRAAVGALRKIGDAAKAAISAMGGLASVIAPVAALYGAINFLNDSLKVLGERQVQVATLQNGLSKIGGTQADIEALAQAADRLGKATLFDQEDFTQGFALLTSFQRIGVDSYERVAKAAADVAQVTGQDVSSALLQLSKALEDPAAQVTALARSGTVFTEQQKEQIKVFQESGQIIKAQNLILSELEKQYGNAANAAGAAGLAGAQDSLGEATRDLQEAIAELALPATIDLINSLTTAVQALVQPVEDVNTVARELKKILPQISVNGEGVKNFFDSVTNAALGSIPVLGQMINLMRQISPLAQRMRDASAGLRNFGEDYASKERALFQATGGFLPSIDKPSPTPTPASASPPKRLKGKSEAEKAAERAARQAEQLRLHIIKQEEQLLSIAEEKEKAFNRQVMELHKQEALLMAGSEEDKKAIEAAFRLGELIREHGVERGRVLSQQEQQVLKLQEQKDKEQEIADAQKQAAERIAQTYRTIGDAIKTGVVDTLMAAVDQTKSLAEVASNTLRSLANTLLKLGIESAFGALGASGGLMGKLFGRANGGTVMGGRSYVVGERGPELFTPNRTGSIAPNNAIGGVGNVVVNVDAKGTNVQGDGAEAKQLGDAIGAAVRIELLKQRRPGGLLA